MIDLANPINWQHELTRGLVLWIKSIPGLRGRWAPDLVQLAGGRGGPRPALQGGVTWTGARGRRGGLGALGFNGVDGQVLLGAGDALELPLPLSLMCHAYFATDGAFEWFLQTDNFDDGNNTYAGVNLQRRSDAVLQIEFGDGGTPQASSRRTKVGTSAVTSGRWWHLAAVVRGATDMTLTLDGRDDGGTYSGTGGDIAYTGDPGRLSTLKFPLTGMLDDIMIYNRALSAPEITALSHLTQRVDNPMLQHLRPRVWSLPPPPAPPPPTAGVPATHRQAFAVTRRVQQAFDVTRRHQQTFAVTRRHRQTFERE